MTSSSKSAVTPTPTLPRLPRREGAAALTDMLADARARTLLLVSDLSGTEWLGPRLEIVNPPLWEIGHLAWFQEFWCLRGGDFRVPSILAHADQLYDSARVAHDTRWNLPLPGLDGTLAYLEAVLYRTREKLDAEPQNQALAYFAELALYHEDMHGEAFAYTRQTLGYRKPHNVSAIDAFHGGGPLPGDVAVRGGDFRLGAEVTDGFVFDNEKWAHTVALAPFRIARAPVTNAEFLNFVEDGGYARAEFWDVQGREWLNKERGTAPLYWLKDGARWMVRIFDDIKALPLHAPVIHINWYEANAYCQWAGRRLPTEAEWEAAASLDGDGGKRRFPWGDELPESPPAHVDGDNWQCADVATYPEGDSAFGCRQMLGNVWEWTADTFLPYPGFVRDPYKEYSEPWFGNHKVLRGGCFVTRMRLLRNTWRNFYTPDRRDVFAGFRTCAIEGAGISHKTP
jgi:iron(II)-dependent oxidoreductase